MSIETKINSCLKQAKNELKNGLPDDAKKSLKEANNLYGYANIPYSPEFKELRIETLKSIIEQRTKDIREFMKANSEKEKIKYFYPKRVEYHFNDLKFETELEFEIEESPLFSSLYEIKRLANGLYIKLPQEVKDIESQILTKRYIYKELDEIESALYGQDYNKTIYKTTNLEDFLIAHSMESPRFFEYLKSDLKRKINSNKLKELEKGKKSFSIGDYLKRERNWIHEKLKKPKEHIQSFKDYNSFPEIYFALKYLTEIEEFPFLTDLSELNEFNNVKNDIYTTSLKYIRKEIKEEPASLSRAHFYQKLEEIGTLSDFGFPRDIKDDSHEMEVLLLDYYYDLRAEIHLLMNGDAYANFDEDDGEVPPVMPSPTPLAAMYLDTIEERSFELGVPPGKYIIPFRKMEELINYKKDRYDKKPLDFYKHFTLAESNKSSDKSMDISHLREHLRDLTGFNWEADLVFPTK